MTFWTFFCKPQYTNPFLVFCILSGISKYKFRVPTKGSLEKLDNPLFHIFSCFEQGDSKSFRAGPYCCGFIRCQPPISQLYKLVIIRGLTNKG